MSANAFCAHCNQICDEPYHNAAETLDPAIVWDAVVAGSPPALAVVDAATCIVRFANRRLRPLGVVEIPIASED